MKTPDAIYIDISYEGQTYGHWDANPDGEFKTKYIRDTTEENKRILKDIERIVNEALHNAWKFRSDFNKREPINWGDLSCVGVGKINDTYLVFIEEASPSATELCNHVYEKLSSAGYANVEIRAEW